MSFYISSKLRIKSFAQRAEIDRAVFYALLTKVWSLVSSPITALLIASNFSPETQGFYYTFGPVMAMQVFLELGFGVAITQFASHEWANLKINQAKRIEGDPDSLSRLASLFHISLKWYTIAAVFLTISLSIGGYIFFSQTPVQNVNWKLPWISLCFLTGINFILGGIWSILEGCNQVIRLYSFRFFQSIVAGFAIWSAILFGAELWTASFISLISIIISVTYLYKNYREFFNSFQSVEPKGPRLNWQSDILPFQWKIALSWVSGYFVFSLFTPILFHYHGPEIAGKMGMTWALYSVITSVGNAWCSPRIPQFGIFAARKEYAEMDKLFYRLTIIIVIISILGSMAVWVFVLGLNYFSIFLANRLLPPLPTAILLVTAVIYNAMQPMSIYLRAHKKEPLLFISVLSGVLIGLSTWILGKNYSVVGMVSGYLLITAFIIFPLVTFVWQHNKRIWHEK